MELYEAYLYGVSVSENLYRCVRVRVRLLAFENLRSNHYADIMGSAVWCKKFACSRFQGVYISVEMVQDIVYIKGDGSKRN